MKILTNLECKWGRVTNGIDVNPSGIWEGIEISHTVLEGNRDRADMDLGFNRIKKTLR